MSKKHFVKSMKHGKASKIIIFCDNVSLSTGFGFKIRKYPNGTRTLQLISYPSGSGKPYTSKEFIPMFLYAEAIKQMKKSWFIYKNKTAIV